MKKFISFVMAILMFGTYSNVFAMDSNPIKPEDRKKIRDEFRKETDSNPGDPHHSIILQLRKPSCLSSDYREVKIYNMQHLMAISEDNENFLQAMIKLYTDAQKHVHEAYKAHNSYKGPEVTMDRAISFANASIEGDEREKEKIRILARETGLEYEEAKWSYLMLVGAEAASKAYSSKYGWKVPTGAFGALGGACLATFCGAKLYMGVKGAAYISLGIGGLLGGAALMGVGLYIANDYVQEQAKKVNVIFRIQRMQNVARAIKQFGSQIVGEPEAVLDSNVLVTAIDVRKDSSDTKFEDKWALWRWWYSDTRNDGAWCRFSTITDLVCAPKASDYVSRDGRSLRTFITIFSRLLNAEVVDFGKLREYLKDPVRFERTLSSIAPTVSVVSEVEESDSD